MQLPLPVQHPLQRDGNRSLLYESESPIVTIRLLIYTPAIKITHHKVARLYFPCYYFFLLIFFILNHAVRSAVRSRHCTRIGRHNLDVYFSGQRGRATGAARRGAADRWWSARRYSLGAIFKN